MLDGELVVYRDVRCDFAALQQRISGRPSLAVAASFVAFDALTARAGTCVACPTGSAGSGCGGYWPMQYRHWR